MNARTCTFSLVLGGRAYNCCRVISVCSFFVNVLSNDVVTVKMFSVGSARSLCIILKAPFCFLLNEITCLGKLGTYLNS